MAHRTYILRQWGAISGFYAKTSIAARRPSGLRGRCTTGKNVAIWRRPLSAATGGRDCIKSCPFPKYPHLPECPQINCPGPDWQGKFSHSRSPLAWQWCKMAYKRRNPAAGTGARRVGGDVYGTTQSQPGLACDRLALWWRAFKAEGSNQEVHGVGMGFQQVTDICRSD